MEHNINELLLQTAFACMACDGDIAPEEVDLIKSLDKDEHLFGDIKIEDKLQSLLAEINELGTGHLKNYLNIVKNAQLNEEDSLKILDVAVKTIKADNIIQYSEVKFFKVIKANLNVSDEVILEKVEGIDEMWVAQDINDYSMIYKSYFDNIQLPTFDIKSLEAQDKKQALAN